MSEAAIAGRVPLMQPARNLENLVPDSLQLERSGWKEAVRIRNTQEKYRYLKKVQ